MDDDRLIPAAEWSFDILKVSLSWSQGSHIYRNRSKTFLQVLPQDPGMVRLLKGRESAYFEFHHDAVTKKLHVGPEVTGLYW